MRFFALAAAFFAIGIAVARADTAAPTCTQTPLATLALTRTMDGAITVGADVGGPHALQFSIDLGSDASFIRDDVAAALKLRRIGVSDSRMLFLGGQQVRERAVISGIKLGGAAADDVRAYVGPASSLADPFSPMQAAGLLGHDLFKQFDVLLDLGHNTLTLYAHTSCKNPLAATVVDFKLNDGRIEFPVSLDGQDLTAELRTGVCCSVMSTMLAHKLFGLGPTSPGVSAEPAGLSAEPTFQYAFHKLTLGKATIANPQITLVDVGGDLHKLSWTAQRTLYDGPPDSLAGLHAGADFPMVHCESCERLQLGLRELSSVKIYFAFDGHEMLVQAD